MRMRKVPILWKPVVQRVNKKLTKWNLPKISHWVRSYSEPGESSSAHKSTTIREHLNILLPYSFEYFRFISGSSVGIVTDYELDGPGIESRWGRDFPPVQTGPGSHPASCKMGTGSFPGVKCGRGVLLTTHPLLVPRSWKSRAVPLPTLWATPGL